MMKNRTKKILGMSLATVMAASVMGGCGQQEVTNTEASQSTVQSSEATVETEVVEKKLFDGVELKVMASYEEGTSTKETLERINAILSEEIGVTITEVEGYTNDTYELILGGDKDMDLVIAANSLRFDANAMDGMYAEITDEDLQTYAPDIWAYATENNKDILDVTKVNGVRYGIGKEMDVTCQTWVYRGDLADKYGIGEINNIDDLEKYLFAIAENEPEMIAMDLPGSSYYSLASAFYNQIGWVAPGATSYGQAINVNFYEDDYKVIFTPETPEYLELVTRMHEWYEKGVFSKSILSSTADLNASFKAGRSGVARISKLKLAQEMYDELQADDRKNWDIRYFACYPEAELLKGSISSLMAISSYSDNVEACLAVLNEVFSNEELYKLVTYGVEGVNYEIVDGKYTAIADEKLGGFHLHVNNPAYAIPERVYTFAGADELVPMMKATAYSYPLCSATFNYDAVAQQKVGIDEAHAQYTIANLLGVFECTPEEAVAAEIAAYKAAGVDEYIAELQRQIDEYVANLK